MAQRAVGRQGQLSGTCLLEPDGSVTAMAQTFAGKRCLLTGAASGIGRSTALRLAQDGAELYLTDRDAVGLEQTVADVHALGAAVPEHRALDISDYDAVAAFAADIHAAHPPMDVVMNIAGVSAWGSVDRLTHRHWRSMIDINLMGPIHVIETFVPPMIAARRGGHLVNVSSAAGLVALPWHAAYSASKYGLRGLSEVLRFDLARHRIGVSVVVPGAVQTPLVKTVEIAGVDRDHPKVAPWIDRFSGHALARRGPNPVGCAEESLSHLHLPGHPRAVPVQARRLVAVQRRDATSERVVHPGAETRDEPRHQREPQSHAGVVSRSCPTILVSPQSL